MVNGTRWDPELEELMMNEEERECVAQQDLGDGRQVIKGGAGCIADVPKVAYVPNELSYLVRSL